MAEGEEGREAEVTSYLHLVAQIIPRKNSDYLPFVKSLLPSMCYFYEKLLFLIWQEHYNLIIIEV